MKEFKKFVTNKCKELGILDMENIFLKQETCIMQIINQIIQRKQMEILQFHRKLYLVKEKCMEILML